MQHRIAAPPAGVALLPRPELPRRIAGAPLLFGY